MKRFRRIQQLMTRLEMITGKTIIFNGKINYFYGDLMGCNGIYPVVNVDTLRTGSHGPVEIVSFPIQNGGSFHSLLVMYCKTLEITGG